MKKIILIVFLGLGIILGIIFRDYIDVLVIKQYILDSGWLGPLVFIGLYIFFTILMLPGSLLTILGGTIFGPWGIIINLVAATLGATCAFIISRYISSDWVRQKILHEGTQHKLSKKMHNLMLAVDKNGWQIIALLRLIPAVPFNILNYLLGLTTIPLWVYVVTSVIFMTPGTIAYTYLGILGDLALQGDSYNLIKGVILVISIFIALYLLIKLVKSWRAEDINEFDIK